MDALLNPKVLIDRPVSLRSTSFELQAREGLYEDKKNDCQLDGRRRHKVGPNIKDPPKIGLENFVKLTDLQRFNKEVSSKPSGKYILGPDFCFLS